MDDGHTLRTHPEADFAVVHTVFPQSKGHHNAVGVGVVVVAVLCRTDHHMDVGAEGNLPCVDAEEYDVRSHHDHSSRAEQFGESVRDSAVEGYSHVEEHVDRNHQGEDILDVEANEIDMGHDTALVLLLAGPGGNQ